MTHPYDSQPSRSFWSRSVARAFDAADVATTTAPLMHSDDRIMSAGSCFASNLVPYLEAAGFSYVRTERQHPAFAKLPGEALGYDNFSARYGNIYTARQMLQLVQRSLGEFKPIEDRWTGSGGIILDPFRPGLRYVARSHAEFDALTAQHLEAVRRAIAGATVLIFTIGLTEAWRSTSDGAVFPACPQTVSVPGIPGARAGTLDPQRHAFVNFSASEVTADFGEMIPILHRINPSLRIILTVSPVPLVATATAQHVLSATIYSKSVLLVAAQETAQAFRDVTYFPAYEIVTGPQAPSDFFEADRRNVSKAAVDTVMAAFLSRCETRDGTPSIAAPAPASDLSALSRTLVEAECEEAMSDTRRAC